MGLALPGLALSRSFVKRDRGEVGYISTRRMPSRRPLGHCEYPLQSPLNSGLPGS
jgi:hypothetical protein